MSRKHEETQGAQEGDQEHHERDDDGYGHGLPPPHYYQLDEENRPRRVSAREWSRHQQNFLWVSQLGDITVKTVFHGFDRDYLSRDEPGEELLFGTKIFGGPLHDIETLAGSYSEASLTHQAAVEWVRAYRRLESISGPSGVTS